MRHLFNKLSAFLVMLMCVSAVALAQTEGTTMVVTKKNGDVTRFVAKNIVKVKWTNEIPTPTKGTAKATINGHEVDVPWVQLWENGLKFAEYNVGVTDGKAESYGGYYCWGSSIDQDPNYAHKSDNNPLTGTDDTATNLWGNNWRMPTKAELDDLLANCDVAWTTVGGVNGCKFTGKAEPYKYNSVFFPAAGYCNYGDVIGQGVDGNYWSSTPDGKGACYLYFYSSDQYVEDEKLSDGYSVRAVLAE